MVTTHPTYTKSAEALEIAVEDILAASWLSKNVLSVIFSTESNSEAPIAWHANLKRDAEGILRVLDKPIVIEDFERLKELFEL